VYEKVGEIKRGRKTKNKDVRNKKTGGFIYVKIIPSGTGFFAGVFRI
jgi:hypothetical protein